MNAMEIACVPQRCKAQFEPQFECIAAVRQAIGAVALVLALMSQAATVQASTMPWESGGYSYHADNTPVTKVLEDFCTNFGIALKLAAPISGQINGRVNGATASEFLNRITSTNGLVWFYHAGTLYITTLSDWQTRTLNISRDAIPNLKRVLNDLGVLDSRFGWAAMADQGVVVVSGPRDYVELIAKTAAALNLAPGGQQITIFPLKNASAADRTVSARDQQTLIPGVASILRAIVHGKRSAAGGHARAGAADKSDTGDATAPVGKMEAGDAQARAGSSQNASDIGANVTIEADPRLNAVLIKDVPEAMPMYEKLIAALDVTAGLIEIEAITVDVNSNNLADLGIDWSVATKSTSLGYGDATRAATAGDLSLTYQPNSVTIAGSQALALVAKIRMLESSGNARVVGKPTIVTTDNMVALIDLSQTFYARVTGERVATLTPVTTGVMLKVTPHLSQTANGSTEIRLAIDIEDGNLIDRTGLDLPVVQKSVISTQATIGANQSLLIGGYDTESQSENVQQVPVLSRLPVVGQIFRNTHAEKQRRKRMFLITPRVANIAAQSSADTASLDTSVPSLLSMKITPALDPKLLERRNPETTGIDSARQ